MDYAAVPLAVGLLGLSGVGITAIVTWRKTNTNGNGSKALQQPVCDQHSGFCVKMDEMDRKLDRILDRLNLLG